MKTGEEREKEDTKTSKLGEIKREDGGERAAEREEGEEGDLAGEKGGKGAEEEKT